MNHSDQEIRVLAIHPNCRGFGFVVFEWGERLVDWGLKTVKHDTNTRCMRLIEDLIERYTPDVIVIEDVVARATRRGPRVKNLLRRISRLASQKRIQCTRFSRPKIMESFTGTLRNKYQVASIIAAKLPELAPRLPKPRKPWMPEDPRMSIFAAAALALTFFSDNPAGGLLRYYSRTAHARLNLQPALPAKSHFLYGSQFHPESILDESDSGGDNGESSDESDHGGISSWH